ncbi:MAG: DUF4239 domain-containing protein [Verrucomicrobia bacterium]|nr:DUF4239 domain-containing protein [Verrucomicrobiota bacterium]MBV8378273.1 DUF4239 domain-containing protein [Verrucomicrobiota bacterium]
MNMYWIYDLPNWLFGVLTIAVTAVVGLVGLYATRGWVRHIHGDRHSHNEVVGYFLGAVCVFYGITLGLLAVATWQTYSDVGTRVGEEAAAVGALYRDVSSFPDPNRLELQSNLRQYTRQVIDVAWPQQRRGIVPQDEGVTLSALQRNLSRFEPATEGQKAIYAEAYHGFTQIAELRGRRLQSVNDGLAGPLWIVVLAGAFLTIALTWFFDMRSQSMHLWMTALLSALLGLLIYLLAALDNPFRGEISISPEAFEIMYARRMQEGK